MKSRALVLTLLATAAVSALSCGADARDLTAEILDRPASSRSMPEGVAAPAPKAVEAVIEAPAAEAPILASPASAAVVAPAPETFVSVLAAAYAESPTLRAAREALRAKYEDVVQAEANWRPSISIEGGVTAQFTDTEPGTDDSFVTKDAGLTATQYIYRGGRTLAEVDQQLKLSEAAQAEYDAAVQTTLLNVITAAMDIQRDRATIDLNAKNIEVLTRQLSAVENGFEVGELTRTDVAQAKARLSGAEADIVSAKAAYSNALARFREYAGSAGDDLLMDIEALVAASAPALEQALATADTDNPSIRAAINAEEAAQKAVAVAEGGLLPTVYASGAVSAAWDPTAVLDESRSAALGVRASMPLYEGGATRSAIRQAKLGTYEKRSLVQAARRTVEKSVTAAWNDHESANAAIDAYKKQVEAAQLARDGVYKEREVGQRTVLDTLDADAELLDAQVGLVRAKRDAVVSAFTLMAAMGGLTAEKLGLTGAPDATAYLETARSNLFGTSAEPLQ